MCKESEYVLEIMMVAKAEVDIDPDYGITKDDAIRMLKGGE